MLQHAWFVVSGILIDKSSCGCPYIAMMVHLRAPILRKSSRGRLPLFSWVSEMLLKSTSFVVNQGMSPPKYSGFFARVFHLTDEGSNFFNCHYFPFTHRFGDLHVIRRS